MARSIKALHTEVFIKAASLWKSGRSGKSLAGKLPLIFGGVSGRAAAATGSGPFSRAVAIPGFGMPILIADSELPGLPARGSRVQFVNCRCENIRDIGYGRYCIKRRPTRRAVVPPPWPATSGQQPDAGQRPPSLGPKTGPGRRPLWDRKRPIRADSRAWVSTVLGLVYVRMNRK